MVARCRAKAWKPWLRPPSAARCGLSGDVGRYVALSAILQVSEFVELVVEQHKAHPLPYSFLYATDGFDVTGQIRSGVGVTCATFIVNIFDRLQLHLVDLRTWRRRPKQDAAFRRRIVGYAKSTGNPHLAERLSAEHESFRVKPWEVYGSATHSQYPVRFYQAKKLAQLLSKLIHKRTRTRLT
jgi:hypothetical protein